VRLYGAEADERLSTEDSKGLEKAVRDTVKIESLIQRRLQLKKEKNYNEADQIRKELDVMGIEILDKKDGTTEWRLK
jgi:cysteinyl-tRNA synthetase